MAKAVEAGRAFVSLGIVSTIDKGLAKASKKLKRFGANVARSGAAIATAGAAVLAPLTAAVFKFSAAGDLLNKSSLRTGISVEALSELKFAAEQSGTSLATVSDGIFRAFRRIGNAAISGGGPAAGALKKLGLNAEELSKLKPDEVLGILADSLMGVGNEAKRNQLGFELFGLQFKEMVPFLAQGSAGINALREEVRDLGGTMTGADAQAAADFADQWNKIKTVISSVTLQIGAALAPMLTDLFAKVTNIAKVTISWARENRDLIVMIAKGAAAAVVFGTAIVALGGFIAAAGLVLGGLAAGFAFLLSPIGLVIAGLAVLTGFFFSSFQSMGEIVDWFKGRFGDLVGGIQDSMTAITEAIGQGNFADAWEIIVESMEMIWLDLTAEIMGVWDNAMDALTDAATVAAVSIGKVFEAMGKGIINVLDFITRQQNFVKNQTTALIASITGEKILGGPVFSGSALPGGAEAAIRSAAAGLEMFGSTMGDAAQQMGNQTKKDRSLFAEERKARLSELQGNIHEKAFWARAAKGARDLAADNAPDLDLPGERDLAMAAGGGAARTTTAGTFSSFAAASLGRRGRSVQTQIEENTKKTADATEEAAMELKKQKGGRFA